MMEYHILETLHQYGRTTVLLAKHPKKYRGQRVVIKRTDLKGSSAETRRLAIQEAQMLSRLRHPNIVKCLETWESADDETIWIVMEWAELGDLSRFADGKLSINLQMDILIQLLLALKYLHELGIIHRDVKTRNILASPLLPGAGGSGLRVKLADFGVARLLLKDPMVKTTIGTPFYSCPEIFSGSPYDAKSDIWSLGCVVYELATGRRPFQSSEFKDLSHRVRNTTYEPLPKDLPFGLRDLVDGMLQNNPMLRPSAAELLAHPFIQDHCNRLYSQLKSSSSNGSVRRQYPAEFQQKFHPMKERLGLKGATEAIVLLMNPSLLGRLEGTEESDLVDLAYKAWSSGQLGGGDKSIGLSETSGSVDELTMTMRQARAQQVQVDRLAELRQAIIKAVSWEEFQMIHEVLAAFSGVPRDQIMRYLERKLGQHRHAELLLVYGLIEELIQLEK